MKRGQLVKIVKDVDLVPYWNEVMQKTIGEIAPILEEVGNTMYSIKTSQGIWNYHELCLEPYETKVRRELMEKIKSKSK